MKIEIRTIGDVRILDCSGKITLGEGTMSVRNAVLDILKSGAKSIVLNLATLIILTVQASASLSAPTRPVVNKEEN